MQYEVIKGLAGLDTLSDSTDTAKKQLRTAENILLRPLGGAKRIPTYQRLWSLNNLATYNSGLSINSGSGTVLLQVVNEGKVILVFWDVANSKTLGVIAAADTGAFSGDVTLTAGSAVITVLRTGLAANKRWYCYRFHDEIWMGNGVDTNLIYQYARTALRLRVQGTNDVPDVPRLNPVAPLAIANVQASRDITAAASTITFTADAVNYRGTAGHNIQIAIVASGVSQAIASVRTGAGTSGSPFQITITLGTSSGQSSADAIKAFVDADPNCEGIVSVTLNTPDSTANPALSASLAALAGGVDATTSTGFAVGEVKQFAVTYWDPGTNGMGYESARSDSRSVTISGSAKDISLRVIGNTTGDLARFGYQKVYLLVGSDWKCVATVANTNGAHRIGNDFTITGTYQFPQKRTPPCTMFELFKGKMWASGNPGNPSRVWISKYSSLTELVPEGTDITYYLEISGRSDEPEQPVISAMRAINESDMHVGTQKTITAVDGTSFARNAMARIVAGPVNPTCFSTWAGGGTPYLGADGQLYSFRGYTNGDAEFLDPLAIGVLRDVVDIDTLRLEPQRANLVADPVNRLLWLWAPDTAGVLRGFTFDYVSKGFTGPFDWPKLLSATQIGVTDNRFVGCDEGGNLFVFDTSSASLTDPYATSSAFTYQSAPYTPPAAEAGYGTVTLTDGVLRKAATTVLKTGFLDFGSPNKRKGFYSLEWTTIRNSRGIVSITLTSDLGQSATRTYGDVYGRERHKVLFTLSGHAVQITIRATTAEDCEFALRDLTLGFELQGGK